MNDANPKSDPTRRDVIAGAAAVGVAAGIAPFASAARAQSGKPPHVLIVGAGLAGLCTAYLLQKEGWTCTILEAERNHVGGRVRTMPIGNGLYWEAGAMRIPDNHKITLKYVSEFRLELRQFILDTRAYFARGRKELDEAKIREVYRLAPGEKDKLSKDLWELSVHGPRDRLTPQEKEELNSANTFTSAALKTSGQRLAPAVDRAGAPRRRAPVGGGDRVPAVRLRQPDASALGRHRVPARGAQQRLGPAVPSDRRGQRAPAEGIPSQAEDRPQDGLRGHRTGTGRLLQSRRRGLSHRQDGAARVGRLRGLHRAPVGSAAHRGAVPGRKAAGHSRVLVRARDQDRRPHQAPILGDGGRLLRRHHIHRPDHRLDLLSVRQSHQELQPSPAGPA